MGVPAFFRWLSRKYPSIVVQADDGTAGQYHFDNLYLDMNGIIHPCSHPENKPPPANEEEMFLAIFEYVEDILAIVRPKKVLYMAVDGVAPRAKMNQQRSRRFRAAQEATEKAIEVQKVKDSLAERGIERGLRGWIDRRLSEDYVDKAGIWPKDLVVILSDASVPGEGEHKIMDYIRKQKGGLPLQSQPLPLSSNPNQPRPCDLCGQIGHELKDCTGAELPPEDLPVPAKTDFIYIRLNVLREYLEKECQKGNVRLDFERFIDDYVFLCFFVGNDFLPHLPSLEIRENAIDRLINIYKFVLESQPVPEGEEMYLTKSGILGEVEDEIFKNRQRSEKRWRENNKRRKLERMNADLRWMNPQAVGGGAQRPEAMVGGAAKEEAAKVRANYHNQNQNNNNDRLNSMLVDKDKAAAESSSTTSGAGIKRPLPPTPAPTTVDSDSEPEDLVQLHSDGWKERYYQHKFDCDQAAEISRMVAAEYFKGLCWVLLYYYQGCPDWKWFFPYHYAPFASDFGGVASLPVVFDPKAAPFKPMEQLISKSLPPSWRVLMSSNSSPIIDFYPTAFSIDLNGKKAAWMGVALLPFIDEERLFRALTGRLRPADGGGAVEEQPGRPPGLRLQASSAADEGAGGDGGRGAHRRKRGKYRLMAGKLSISDRFSAAYRRVLCCEFEDPKYEEGFPQDLAQFEHYRPQIGMNRRGDQASLDRSGHRTFERSIQRDYGVEIAEEAEAEADKDITTSTATRARARRVTAKVVEMEAVAVVIATRTTTTMAEIIATEVDMVTTIYQNDRRNYGGGGNGGGGGGNYRNNGNNNSYNSGGNNRGNNGGGGQYPQRSNYQQQQQQSYGGHQQQQYHQQAQQRSNYSSGSYYNNASSNYPTSSNYGGQHSYQQSYGGSHYQQQPPQQHSYAQQSYYGQPQSYAAAAPGANAPRQAPYSAAAIPQYYTSDYVPKGGGASGSSNVGNGNAAAADKYRQQNYKRY
ncbi:5'-3' exoribonuclease 2 [Tyrophagus putrescentiae]|nr:5'-3' exoribonuclease 2 [Tyrophagus putrescentiae]